LCKNYFFTFILIFLFQKKNVSAGENNGTIGTYGVTDGNGGAVVRLSNNETYTNNGNILGWRGLVNIRSRSGTTTINSAGALIDFSGTGGWMPGGTNAETSTSTLNNTLENYGTIGRTTANNRPVHTESTGNNTVNNYATGSILSRNIAVSFWSNRGTNSFTNSGTVTGGNYGFEASYKDRGQAGSLATLSLAFTNNSGATITGTNQNGAHIAAPDVSAFTNAGTITGGVDGVWFHSGTTATTFTNTGTITGATIDIDNDGTITTMSNDQGGDDTLTFDGKVPTNYKVIINSTTDFGKIDFSNETGSLTFAIDSSSTLSASTYASVLQNIADGNIGNEATWTNYNSTYKWRLVANGTDWDLEIANRRTAYTTRITGKLNKILEVLENINTNSSNTTLTTALDSLSDSALEKVASQIEGVTIKSINGQSFKNHSTFKRAVSSALATPSVSSLTRNNYASLSLNDLNFNQSQNEYQMYSANSFDFKSMANIFKNKDLFSLKSKGSTLFFRTFADQTNQDKIGTDTGFESSTAGFLLGNQNNLTDDIEQGWSFGYSSNDTDFDENYGNSEANTLHAMIYQNQQYDNFVLGLNLGTYISRTDMDREITDGSVQTLKSRSYNYGFDITADIKQSYQLENNFTFTPSFSTNLSYIIQDDLDESGGDLALSVKNDNLLIVKPEIGFALEKSFNQTDQVSKSLGFSVYGSYEEKLDGTTSKAKIKDTGSNFDIVDENKDDTFVTTGLGYTFLDKIDNTEYNFGVYYTQNDNNNLNSTLASFNYNKKF
jgi:uncharacterized protein with beta-barrel porin domain